MEKQKCSKSVAAAKPAKTKQKPIKEDCIEVEAKLEDIPTKLKFCIVGDKYEMDEQTPTIKIKK